MQLREIRVEQQLRRVYAYRRLTLAFTAQYPLGVHQAPEIWTYTQHSTNTMTDYQY